MLGVRVCVSPGSSQVFSAAWNPNTEVMTVYFRRGAAYRYSHISLLVWEAYKAAKSKGAFVRTLLHYEVLSERTTDDNEGDDSEVGAGAQRGLPKSPP